MKQGILKSNLGEYQQAVNHALDHLKSSDVLNRIRDHDHTVWSESPTEITNRLGWLDIADRMKGEVGRIETFTDKLRNDGFTHVLLLGMGGSSLAPEVFRVVFGVKSGYLDLAVLDSTDPGSILSHQSNLNLEKTLFIVATKSGGTVETLSFFKYFYNLVEANVGQSAAGNHFIAITDAGSKLETIAKDHSFRKIFFNDPNIGGRYSVLSFFGLVPAALIGVDISLILDRAIKMAGTLQLGAELGAIMGTLAQLGKDKLTFLTSKEIDSFVDWVEQLVAESTGKNGVGILPVVREPWIGKDVYGVDRLFISMQLGDDDSNTARLKALQNEVHPVVKIRLTDIYDLGGQFFLWELATAVAGHFLEINPFEQPNVESAKILARDMVAEYSLKGTLPPVQTAQLSKETIHTFLKECKPGDYIAIQAYLQPTNEVDSLLQELREDIFSRYKVATTLGYGPRYLHSTGQLHKGDSGNGLFIQLIADDKVDSNIPDVAGKPGSSMSFSTLKMAQALGDGQALRDQGRRFIRLNLGDDIESGIKSII